LEDKLADANAKVLLAEDDNNKMKTQLVKALEDKKNIQTKLNNYKNVTNNNDDIRASVSNINDDMSEMRAEITELKALLLNKPQSTVLNKSQSIVTEQAQTTSAQAETKPGSKTAQPSSKKKTLIIGDSVTNVLDQHKMSTDKMLVKVRSNPGATVKSLTSKIEGMSSEEAEKLQSDAVMIHVGINDICEGQTPDQVLKDFQDLSLKAKAKFNEPKLIISSILPMKRMKLSKPVIDEVNKRLHTFADTNGLTFLDNTSTFQDNMSLYRDELHCSVRGTVALARNMKIALMESLHIQTSRPVKPHGNHTPNHDNHNRARQQSRANGNFHQANQQWHNPHHAQRPHRGRPVRGQGQRKPRMRMFPQMQPMNQPAYY